LRLALAGGVASPAPCALEVPVLMEAPESLTLSDTESDSLSRALRVAVLDLLPIAILLFEINFYST
jgi:hypothetical protein